VWWRSSKIWKSISASKPPLNPNLDRPPTPTGPTLPLFSSLPLPLPPQPLLPPSSSPDALDSSKVLFGDLCCKCRCRWKWVGLCEEELEERDIWIEDASVEDEGDVGVAGIDGDMVGIAVVVIECIAGETDDEEGIGGKGDTEREFGRGIRVRSAVEVLVPIEVSELQDERLERESKVGHGWRGRHYFKLVLHRLLIICLVRVPFPSLSRSFTAFLTLAL